MKKEQNEKKCKSLNKNELKNVSGGIGDYPIDLCVEDPEKKPIVQTFYGLSPVQVPEAERISSIFSQLDEVDDKNK